LRDDYYIALTAAFAGRSDALISDSIRATN